MYVQSSLIHSRSCNAVPKTSILLAHQAFPSYDRAAIVSLRGHVHSGRESSLVSQETDLNSSLFHAVGIFIVTIYIAVSIVLVGVPRVSPLPCLARPGHVASLYGRRGCVASAAHGRLQVQAGVL